MSTLSDKQKEELTERAVRKLAEVIRLVSLKDDTSQWTVLSEKKGLTGYRKVYITNDDIDESAYSKGLGLYAGSKVTDLTPKQMLHCCSDRGEFVKTVEESVDTIDILEQVMTMEKDGMNMTIELQRTKKQFIMSPREFCLCLINTTLKRAKAEIAKLDGDDAESKVSDADDDAEVYVGAGFTANPFNVPETDGFVRGSCEIGGFVVRGLENNTKSILTTLSSSDIKGSVPAWVLKKAGPTQCENPTRYERAGKKHFGIK